MQNILNKRWRHHDIISKNNRLSARKIVLFMRFSIMEYCWRWISHPDVRNSISRQIISRFMELAKRDDPAWNSFGLEFQDRVPIFEIMFFAVFLEHFQPLKNQNQGASQTGYLLWYRHNKNLCLYSSLEKNFFNWPDAIKPNPKYISKGTSDHSDLENEQTVPFRPLTHGLVRSKIPWEEPAFSKLVVP